MKVLFDDQVFKFQKVGGISRYFSELIKYGNELNLFEPQVPFKFSDNFYLNTIAGYDKYPLRPRIYRWRGRYRVIQLKNWFDFQLINYWLKNNRTDLFHPTYYHINNLNLNGVKLIVTVHDLIHEKFPNYFSGTDAFLEIKRQTIQRADKVIAVSNTTKWDLVDIYKIKEEKIEVIYHGNSIADVKPKEIKLPNRYILYVGSRDGYKNFDKLLEAFSLIRNQDEKTVLICAGGGVFSPRELARLEELKLQKRIFQVFPDDRELKFLYRNCLTFIFPSLYEGFGLPLIEADSQGANVLCSDINVFREISQGKATFFDPRSSEEIRRCLENVTEVTDKALNSPKFSENFNWKTTAEETAKVYEQII